MQQIVYLDNAATTPCDPRVVAKMLPFLGEQFGNPASSSHLLGQSAATAVQDARAIVAQLIGSRTDEVIWTSGATESINLALQGAMRSEARAVQQLITFSTEHKAVLDTAHALAARDAPVTVLDPDDDGRINLEQLTEQLRGAPALVSVLFVNNEIGTIQDISVIARFVHDAGGLLHVDAAQATGKVHIDVESMGIDLMSMCAHKTYGPKGIGALYVRSDIRKFLRPLIFGGGHEKGLRSGTLPTHQIVGFGEAFRIAQETLATGDEVQRIRELRDRLLRRFMAIAHIKVNGSLEHRIPHNLNLSIAGTDAESLLQLMPDVCLSTGSACSSGIPGPSHVLRALGLSLEDAESSMRISLGRLTTELDIDHAADRFAKTIAQLRQAGKDAYRHNSAA